MPDNNILSPQEAAFIATNAYFTLKDWINYSDGKAGNPPKRNPTAAVESRANISNRVLGSGTAGQYAPRHNTSLQGSSFQSASLGNIHTAKTGNNVESGFGYTLNFSHSGKNHLVVAVRGTRPEMGWADLATDAHGSLARFGNLGAVHAGFKNTFDSMLPSVERDRAAIAGAHVVHFVGHSLGGAVATLLAAHYANTAKAVKLYTFGSPRVGALLTHKTIENTIGSGNIYRVAHNLDPISLVGPFPYFHVNSDPSKPGFMTVKSPFNLSMKNHDMMSYIDTVTDADSWSGLELASKSVRHNDGIIAQMLLNAGGDDPGWLMAGCARALTYLFKLFEHKLNAKAWAAGAVGALTCVDLLAELVYTGAHKLQQLGNEIMGLMRWAAKWAKVQVAKGAEFTGAIIKAILDKMLATLKNMAVAAVSRGPIGLTPMGLAVPGWALMSASGF